MAIYNLDTNTQANESLSKFKLLSAYGGPGSIMHTQYGSIIVSCIEEWGFLKLVNDFHLEATNRPGNPAQSNYDYVAEQSALPRQGNIILSNDSRFIEIIKKKKQLDELKYLVLIPDLEIDERSNRIADHKNLSISSSFFPKVFSNKYNHYKKYRDWYNLWQLFNPTDRFCNNFFPPKTIQNLDDGRRIIDVLKQDNIVLICGHGHISDFPWSHFLGWRTSEPMAINDSIPVDLFSKTPCCNNPKITIKSSASNSSGFDGKQLKCDNEACGRRVSLKGLFNVKVKCPGHKPWESETYNNEIFIYSGNQNARNTNPPDENCSNTNFMKVALTTGNNLYFSNIMSSIYMPSVLFKNEHVIRFEQLENELQDAMNDRDFALAQQINVQITEQQAVIENMQEQELSDDEMSIKHKFEEFNAFLTKSDNEINIDLDFLKVTDSTTNLSLELSEFFDKILRIDNLKLTSAQLDFSRVMPADGDDAEVQPKNIFRSLPSSIISYPAVENFGEGIFFAISEQALQEYILSNEEHLETWKKKIVFTGDNFSRKSFEKAINENWSLYLVHSLSHLIMRELEFRCGYPTASLQERIYVSNDERFKMNGFLIYTVEGAEGSMGGLIAQTKGNNLNNLIKSALIRSTVCHSDPLCWESEGQGLFNLNFASCFSCGLVSETSCELRNIYLDRRILVDEDFGFFRNILNI